MPLLQWFIKFPVVQHHNHLTLSLSLSYLYITLMHDHGGCNFWPVNTDNTPHTIYLTCSINEHKEKCKYCQLRVHFAMLQVTTIITSLDRQWWLKIWRQEGQPRTRNITNTPTLHGHENCLQNFVWEGFYACLQLPWLVVELTWPLPSGVTISWGVAWDPRQTLQPFLSTRTYTYTHFTRLYSP